MKKAVFLDKDGTIIENVPYNVDPRRICFSEGARFCLRHLYSAGYQFVVVSNQSGVARGCFTEEALGPVRERLEEMFREAGVRLLDFRYCPHHPDGNDPQYAISCSCRKPEPGLLIGAAHDHAIDLASSWIIGDILNDVEAGHRAGCRAVLLNNGNETEWLLTRERTPDLAVGDLSEAAVAITSASLDRWTIDDRTPQL